MDEQALLIGVAARPGSQPEACRVKFGVPETPAGGVDEGLDVNVHGFGPSPISVQLAPRGSLPNLPKQSQERGRPRRKRNWSAPTVLFVLRTLFRHYMSFT